LKNELQSKGKAFEFPREIPVNAARLPPSGGRNFAVQNVYRKGSGLDA
jgi:hypothetical protein